MLMRNLFGENLLDDFFNVPVMSGSRSNVMHTDVKEKEGGFEISMELPGYKKEDVKGELKDGYLIVSATTNSSKDEKDDEGRYIRRERYSGSCSRSFYVGEDITQDDIKAKFEDGVLKIDIPKKGAKPAVEDKRYIAIEG